MSGNDRRLVALIHATPAAMEPATRAITEASPESELWNLLDDRLMSDAEAAGGLTPELESRMSALIDYALAGGADVVQLTCSLFGRVADGFSGPVAVRASDAAMLDRLAADHPSRVGVLASLPSSADELIHRIDDVFAASGHRVELTPVVVPGALDAVRRSDTEALLSASETALSAIDRPLDGLAIAQYSLTGIADQLRRTAALPVYSPVQLMAENIHDLVAAPSPAARP